MWGAAIAPLPAEAETPKPQNLEPPVTVQAETDGVSLCDGDRIDFSPTGRFVVSIGPAMNLAVFPTDCIL